MILWWMIVLKLITRGLWKSSWSKERALKISNNYGVNCKTNTSLEWRKCTTWCIQKLQRFLGVDFSSVTLQDPRRWWPYGSRAMVDWILSIVCSRLFWWITIADAFVLVRKPFIICSRIVLSSRVFGLKCLIGSMWSIPQLLGWGSWLVDSEY